MIDRMLMFNVMLYANCQRLSVCVYMHECTLAGRGVYLCVHACRGACCGSLDSVYFCCVQL